MRAFVFTTLVLMNIGLILVNRSFDSSLAERGSGPTALWALVSAVLIVLGAAIYWPPAEDLFHFGAASGRSGGLPCRRARPDRPAGIL